MASPSSIPLPGHSDVSLTVSRQGDQKDLIRILNDPEMSYQLQNVPYPYTQASADFFVSDSIAKENKMLPLAGKPLEASVPDGIDLFQLHLPWNFIRLTSSQRLIGNIRLKPLDSGTSSTNRKSSIPSVYELGYFLEKDYQSQGILTTALQTLIQQTRENYKHVKLIRARVWEMNLKSAAVCKRIGFAKVGEETTVWPETKGGGEKRLEIWELSL